MQVKELMKKEVITVTRDDELEEAIKLLEKHDIGMLVVTNKKLVEGVITDRDILIRKVLKNKSIWGKVKEAMTYTVVLVNETDTIDKVYSKLKEYQLRRLPVVNNNNELVGIITLSDLAICKETKDDINLFLRDIVLPNPQTEKPLKYLKVDDFPL